MTTPLEGIRVLEWAMWMSGPMSTSYLGDMGADVIKIEQPGTGDNMRGLLTGGDASGSDRLLPDGRHVLFEAYNRNKRSIVLDLTKEKGRELAYQLVKWADVFVHNFPINTTARLGMDYQTLSKINPLLIYAGGSSYGRKGPDRDVRAYDMAGKARSGHMIALTGLDADPEEGVIGLADQITAIMLSQGVLTALVARERLGIGQEVDVSMLGSMIYLQHWAVSYTLFLNKLVEGQRPRKKRNVLYSWYKCKDGKWIALIMVQSDRYWPDFCRTMGLEALEKDPKFDNMFHRQDNSEELVDILDKIFAAKTREEWIEIYSNAKLPFCPVNSMLDLSSDPQVVENDYIIDFDHPSVGKVNLTGFPVQLSKTPPSMTRAAPLHGQHTEEILQEVLGLSWDDITPLKDEGIIN